MASTSRRRSVYTRQQRWAHVARFERSGLSATEFCRRARIHLSTFSQWRHGGGSQPEPTFAEVQLSAAGPAFPMTLHLPGGAKLEVAVTTDAMWLGLGVLLNRLQA